MALFGVFAGDDRERGQAASCPDVTGADVTEPARSGSALTGTGLVPLTRRRLSESRFLPRRSLGMSAENVFGDACCAAAIVPALDFAGFTRCECLAIRCRIEGGAHVVRAFRPLRLGSWCHDGRLSSACRSLHTSANSSLSGDTTEDPWRKRAVRPCRYGTPLVPTAKEDKRGFNHCNRRIRVSRKETGKPPIFLRARVGVALMRQADRFSVATKKPSVP